MTHTIIVRPASDFEPHIDGIVNHTVQIADGAEIITESTEYLRRLGEALIARADRVDAASGKQTESVDLEHPGTWLPGDRVVSAGDDSWTFVRDLDGEWHATNGKGFLIDRDINISHQTGSVHITHLVPRTGGAA